MHKGKLLKANNLHQSPAFVTIVLKITSIMIFIAFFL
jgi:hypothetical protein